MAVVVPPRVKVLHQQKDGKVQRQERLDAEKKE